MRTSAPSSRKGGEEQLLVDIGFGQLHTGGNRDAQSLVRPALNEKRLAFRKTASLFPTGTRSSAGLAAGPCLLNDASRRSATVSLFDGAGVVVVVDVEVVAVAGAALVAGVEVVVVVVVLVVG